MRLRRSIVIAAALAASVFGLTAPASARPASSPPPSGQSLAGYQAMETSWGPARTAPVPGGYLVVHSSGQVAMMRDDGRAAWSRDAQSLYHDWQLTWQASPPTNMAPQVAWGGNPYDPLEFSGPGNAVVNDVTPFAAGDLGGRPEVAVAEVLGANINTASSCLSCFWQFNVPGSSLHVGTFVTVFDARTGKTVYHELEPGFVTQLAITDGRLIIGDETGDPQFKNAVGDWGSVSTVRALEFDGNGNAHQAWRYSTGAPWARLLAMAVTGRGSGVALAWSDTPAGLGVPGPPDGHVLLLDARTGAPRWHVRTAGYPVLAAADDARGELAVVQRDDPTRSISYTITGLSYADGRTEFSAQRDNAAPISLAVGRGWATGAVDAKPTPAGYAGLDGRVTLTDPGSGAELWSTVLPAPAGMVPSPGGLVSAGGRLLAGSWLGTVTPTAAAPLTAEVSITCLNGRTGAASWTKTGDPGDPMSLSVASPGGGLVRAVDSHQVERAYAPDGRVTESASAGPGDFLSETTASIATGGGTDLVAGNEDGDVYAFDGSGLAAGSTEVLWRTHLPGPVHQVASATLDGRKVIVAAATSAVAVIDARSGRLLTLIGTPGTYAYTITVIQAAGTAAVVVPGTSLTAYSLADGSPLWQYPAPSGAWFSDAVYADGVVAAEYSNAAGYGPDSPATEMAAMAVSAETGSLLWSQPSSPSAIELGDLWNGVAIGPDGVAFTWQTRDGSGDVDVRNIATGDLVYSNVSRLISQHTQFIDDPAGDLIAVSRFGAVLIGPAGGQASSRPAGTSAAYATSAAGTSALLVANTTVTAWGTNVFTNPVATQLAADHTDNQGTLLGADFSGAGPRQVAAVAADWLAYQVVQRESGAPLRFLPVLPVAHGLSVLTLTQSSAPAHASVVSPAVQRGSAAAAPEPVRSGVGQPAISADKARHTASAASPAALPGYPPALMRQYLGLTGDGSGQTIAIVDAYNDPAIVSDAQAFSSQFGLPPVCGDGGATGDCFTLRVDQQDPAAAADAGWALETSLDVEWAHALAPHATIVLVEASDASFAAMFRAVDAAWALHPAAVSMSWGIDFEFSDETYYDHFCSGTGSVCVTSSGDAGHPGNYPAYNPAAIAIGGSTLSLGADGSVNAETTWSGSGGGQSSFEPEPGYQQGAQQSGRRQIPDVSFDANPATGVPVYDTIPYHGQAGWWQVGGTSVGAPSWSAILADADQLRAANALPPLTADNYAAQDALYAQPPAVIAPITSGPANGFCPSGCEPAPGYDEITGLGSPRTGIDAALAAS